MPVTTKTNKLSETAVVQIPNSLTQQSYTATTSDIKITVWPDFIDSKISNVGELYIWAYHVRIDNKSSKSVKLIERYWKIIDERGLIQEVRGDGVIGEQPLILQNNFFQYSSGVHLNSPSGVMSGFYKMKIIDEIAGDKMIEVKIPSFSLDTPGNKAVVN
jgi:ApaG protein